MTLNEFFAAHPKCALGFSGGVDSAYLLYAGVRAGADLRPYYIKTAFQPRFEQDDALRLAGELGVEVTVLELDALADPGWRPTGGAVLLLQAEPVPRAEGAGRGRRVRRPAGRHQRLRRGRRPGRA